MAPLDKQYSNGLVGPFALRTEKVALGVFAALFAVALFVLFVLEPDDPTSLYIFLPLPVAMIGISTVRLRRMLREDEQDESDAQD
ncbi:hypothetical protein [Nocardioides campestrisoli]|uniref:hypothetical protein n=1 Tax=Nocardioides campestrisoli TaxID=2736757 RepID=UPI00163D74ED|nr:hypothetical protein [Nocardioides campestrisoli]